MYILVWYISFFFLAKGKKEVLIGQIFGLQVTRILICIQGVTKKVYGRDFKEQKSII